MAKKEKKTPDNDKRSQYSLVRIIFNLSNFIRRTDPSPWSVAGILNGPGFLLSIYPERKSDRY